jgi:hypothetical protein
MFLVSNLQSSSQNGFRVTTKNIAFLLRIGFDPSVLFMLITAVAVG